MPDRRSHPDCLRDSEGEPTRKVARDGIPSPLPLACCAMCVHSRDRLLAKERGLLPLAFIQHCKHVLVCSVVWVQYRTAVGSFAVLYRFVRRHSWFRHSAVHASSARVSGRSGDAMVDSGISASCERFQLRALLFLYLPVDRFCQRLIATKRPIGSILAACPRRNLLDTCPWNYIVFEPNGHSLSVAGDWSFAKPALGSGPTRLHPVANLAF